MIRLAVVFAFAFFPYVAGAVTCADKVVPVPQNILKLIKPQPIVGDDSVPPATTYAEAGAQNLIVVGYEDGTVRFFDRDTGRQRTGQSQYNYGYLSWDSAPVGFLGFMEKDQILVIGHSAWTCVGYYMDIRTFFKPCLAQAGIAVGKAWHKNGVELMSQLMTNYEPNYWPDSPVPIECK